MPNQWFQLPETGDGSVTDPYRPAYIDEIDGLDGHSGNKTAGEAPKWVARVYGTDAALSELASKPDTVELADDEAARQLNQMDSTAGERSPVEWAKSFSVGNE